MKKIIFIVTILCFFIISCGNTNVDSKEAADNNDPKQLKVGLVVAGGLGDKSFYDASYEGLKLAEEKLGVKGVVFESKNDPSLYQDQLIQASINNDIIVISGYEYYEAIQEVAREFPTKKYIYLDTKIRDLPNLVSIDYMENEGSFLAGALAAMLTQTNNIAMLGGVDLPVIKNFEVGYQEGAKYINPDIKIQVMYIGDFEDPIKGKEGAGVLYNQGVDIIYAVAGKTGQGVFDAGKELKKFAIGVDSDQRYINPDVILFSMVKNVSGSVYETIEKIKNGEKIGASVITYGIKENGVVLSYGENMDPKITVEMKHKIEELKEKIINGEIKVTSKK